MQLFLLRHGIPVEPEHWEGSDHSRPLTEFGRKQAQEVIQALVASEKLSVDAIWASPYLRTQETARIAGQILGIAIETENALSSGSDLIHSLPHFLGSAENWPERLLLVGHQPDLGNLATDLTGNFSSDLGLGRAGMAHLSGKFRRGGMSLQWLHSAEEILSRLRSNT